MFNFDVITNENSPEHNLKWLSILDHSYRTVIIGGSGSEKTNILLKLMKEQDSDVLTVIYKTYLYAEDLNEPKYQLSIKKREDAGTKHLNDPKAFTEYSNTMDDVYNNIDNYNPKRKT